jgi:hypothetical protein
MDTGSSGPAWFEWVKLLPGFVTAVTAVWGVSAGLSKWRSETIGKRKVELAEQFLTTAYKARDLLTWARTPVLFAGEGETRKPVHPEDDALRERRNGYYVPIERLARETETFSTLQALKYPVSAYFGPAAANPIATIMEGYRSITSAASLQIQIAQHADDPVARANSMDQLSASLGRGPRPDKFDQNIDAAISSVEEFCRQVLSQGVRS